MREAVRRLSLVGDDDQRSVVERAIYPVDPERPTTFLRLAIRQTSEIIVCRCVGDPTAIENWFSHRIANEAEIAALDRAVTILLAKGLRLVAHLGRGGMQILVYEDEMGD